MAEEDAGVYNEDDKVGTEVGGDQTGGEARAGKARDGRGGGRGIVGERVVRRWQMCSRKWESMQGERRQSGSFGL